ncbi:hypothetical protein HT031_000103 [Scenedesmus sp. PABB004]|nr:hypothetical protein HT031_000103 [Scenedesmus sp. PABB004]
MAHGGGPPGVFYDEEDCLGFGVFVAELELVLGTARDRRPDQGALLALLQKLQAAITTAPPALLRQHQKRCEAALYDIIHKGACGVVRGLVALCLCKLYAAGDLLPLFSRVNALQALLQDRGSTAPESVRLGVMDLLAHLAGDLGRFLASSSVESMAIATKALAKGSSAATKAAGLRLARAVVEGLPQLDRNAPLVQAEAWKLFEKQVKVRRRLRYERSMRSACGSDSARGSAAPPTRRAALAVQDKASEEALRAAAAGLLGAMCRGGGAALWASGSYYAEEAVRLLLAGLEEAGTPSAREAFALALADLAAASRAGSPALVAALAAEKKPAKRAQLEKAAGGVFRATLVAPFVAAAVAGDQDVCTALALGWTSYAAGLAAGSAGADALIELALSAVAMLEAASKEAAARGAPPPDAQAAHSNLGACLAGGEMPGATAAVIYFLRAGVIRRLHEPAQRALLAALATATSHAIAPPVILAAMEGCGLLLEQLGELHDEGAIRGVENAAMSKLSASSTAVRHQAAAVLAALALSSPPLLARLFGECLEGVETFCQQLMLLAAPYTKPRALGHSASGAAGAPGGSPGTPRGAPDSQTKHCIDGLHGNALAVGALLVAAARSALGAPSRLTRSVFWIAKRMISQPYCSCPWAVAAEREAGYMLLAAMCAAAPPGLLAGREKQAQLLDLLAVALGRGAADALAGCVAAAAGQPPAGSAAADGAGGRASPAPPSPGQGGGAVSRADAEQELAVAAWWRAAALQALSAYVLGVMGKGFAEDPEAQVRRIGAMLRPLLEVVCQVPQLADPAAPSPSAVAPAPPPGGAANGAAPPAPAAAGSGAGAGAALPGCFASPVASAAAALLQLRLVEAFFFLPAPALWADCHSQLLQLCCRQLMAAGGSRVSPEAAASVAASSLKHVLNSQDALLGPWLPGRDMLEDELRTFVGERGGPQQHPWEVGAAFTEGFIAYSQALLPPDDGDADASADDAAATAAAAAAAASGGGAPLGALAGDASSAGGAGAPAAPQLAAGAERRRGVDGVRLRRRFMPYPQPYALAPALLEAQLWLLGKLLAAAPGGTQLQVLEVMLGAVSLKAFAPLAAAAGRAAAARQRAANCTAVALAGLAGLGPLAKRALRGEGGSDKVAEKALQLASCLLEEQVADPCLARAGAEMMAAATAIGSTALALGQVKAIACQLLAMMSEASGGSSSGGAADGAGAGGSAELRAVLCLVLGCVYRAKGGAALQPTVAASVEALVAVASRPVGVAHIWALHGLWLVASAAGPGYAAHVKPSLQLALELLVSSFGEHPLLQPAAARLANAMIAVLGSEFTLGSAAYDRCKALAPAAPAGAADGQRALTATWAELEQVLFAQQLILFAPRAVPAAKHLPLLLLTLTSSRPALRRAAAATLRHLAERDAPGLAEASIEVSLLAALDGESEASTSAAIRATLAALLTTSAPSRPGYWLRLLGGVALAAGPAAAGAPPAGQGGTAIRADVADDDDEDGPAQPPAQAPAGGSSAGSGTPASPGQPAAGPGGAAAAAAAAAAASAVRLPPTPRLRTRLFAAELLLGLFAAVGPDPAHRFPWPKYDEHGAPLAPAAGEPQDVLVGHLQPLIDLGFKLTTGPAEALRPAGAQLLRGVLRAFGSVPDPDVPGMLLLEQYQAQFVAALRAALAPGAAPALAVAGGALATSFLGAGLAAGDGAVMRRLMGLLAAPLQGWAGLLYGGHAEAVGVRARVALLQAHAQCANLASALAASSGDGGGHRASHPGGAGARAGALCRDIVATAQAPHRDLLLLLWWGLLLDCAAFSSPLPGVLAGHKSLLFGDSHPEIVDAVQGTFAAAWPAVLVALASGLPPPAELAAAVARASGEQQQPPAVSSGAGLPRGDVFARQLQLQCGAMHAALVDISSMLLCDAAAACGAALAGGDAGDGGSPPRRARVRAPPAWGGRAAVAAAQRAAVALQALQLLLSRQHFEAGLAPPGTVQEVAGRLSALALEVLAPWQRLRLQQQEEAQQAAAGVAALSLGAGAPPALRSGDADADAHAAAADRAFGLLLTAAADQCQALAAGLHAAAGSGGGGAADQGGGAAELLEALLALSSVAAPFEARGAVVLPAGARRQRAAAGAAAASGGAPSSSAQLASAEPTGPVVAACSSLCLAGSSLLQAARAEQFATLLPALSGLGLRLLLTAAPGAQLAAAQALLDSCWSAAAAGAAAAGQQQQPAAAPACEALCAAAAAAAVQVCGSARGQPAIADAAARLPALLAALLAAAASCCAADGAAASPAAAQQCCGVLLWALQQHRPGGAAEAEGPALVACKVLEAVRSLLQDDAAQQQAGRAALAQLVTAAVVPQAAALAHAALSCGAGPLAGATLAAVTEALKVLLLLSTRTAAQGEAAQVAVMRVLVPLLVEAASPPPGSPGTPLLRDMACRLVSAMPASAASAAFRAAVAALPAASKARLQAALREQAGAAAAAQAGPPAGGGLAPPPGAGAGAGAHKPAIQLRMSFAVPPK